MPTTIKTNSNDSKKRIVVKKSVPKENIFRTYKPKNQFDYEKEEKIKDIQDNSGAITLTHPVNYNLDPIKSYKNKKERDRQIRGVLNTTSEPADLKDSYGNNTSYSDGSRKIKIDNKHLLSPNKKEIDDTFQHELTHSTQSAMIGKYNKENYSYDENPDEIDARLQARETLGRRYSKK